MRDSAVMVFPRPCISGSKGRSVSFEVGCCKNSRGGGRKTRGGYERGRGRNRERAEREGEGDRAAEGSRREGGSEGGRNAERGARKV